MGLEDQPAAAPLFGCAFGNDDRLAAAFPAETNGNLALARDAHPLDSGRCLALRLAVRVDLLRLLLAGQNMFRQWRFGAIVAPCDARVDRGHARI